MGILVTPERRAEQSEATKAQWANQNGRLRASMSSPERKAKIAKAIKNRWADPEFRAIYLAKRSDPEYKARQSETIKTLWANAEYRANQLTKMSAIQTAKWADREYRTKQLAKTTDPEVTARRTGKLKTYWSNPELRSIQSEAAKALWSDPKYRAKRIEATKAAWADPAIRAKYVEAAKARRDGPETRAKKSGSNKASWATNSKRRTKQSGDMKTLWNDPEYRANQLVKRSNPELRAKWAEYAAKQSERWPKPKTRLEYALAAYLTSQGLDFREQFRFGRYVVDAYVLSLNIAYEADGDFWHKDKERKAKRDAYLLDRGISEIRHLSQDFLEGVNGR